MRLTHISFIQTVDVFSFDRNSVSSFKSRKCLSKSINYIFSRKKNLKNVCIPYLKFSDLLPKTHLFFYLALSFKCDHKADNTPPQMYFEQGKFDEFISPNEGLFERNM